ncbi:hypothetical protein GQ457_06G020360 [Hibiscus cannabinus]
MNTGDVNNTSSGSTKMVESGQVSKKTSQAMNLNATAVAMSHNEKPSKFTGQNFKTWQQKMLFYLTMLNLAKYLNEDSPVVTIGDKEGEIEMSSGTGVRLPVIDFSTRELKPDSPDWDLVKVQVRQALEEFGCFEALFDKVLEVRDVLFGAMEELFDLPSPTKQLCTSDKPYRGYHESMMLRQNYCVPVDEAHIAQIIDQDLTNILWPQGNISFSKIIVSFTQLAAGLEKTIRRMVLESFGVEKYMDELNDATNYNLRALKYGSGEPLVAAGVHTAYRQGYDHCFVPKRG